MSIWIGILASSGQKISAAVRQFLFGTRSGLLYTIDANNTTAQISGFNTGQGTTLDPANTGVTWTTQTSGITGVIESVAYGNGLWVAFRASTGLNSTDGITWTTFSNSGTILYALYNNNIWVGVGSTGIIRTSSDGFTWTNRTSNFSGDVTSVAYGNGLWVAVGGGGGIRTSTNAITWTTQNSNFGTTNIWSVAFGNGVFVAGGSNGQIRNSTDGVTWVTQTPSQPFSFGVTVRSVAYGNGLWVIGGYNGGIATSTDTTTWTSRTSNTTSNIHSIAYSNGLWIFGGDTGVIRTSTNAITWTTRTSNFGTSNIREISFGNNLWIAVGYGGQIRTSPQVYTSAFSPINDIEYIPSASTTFVAADDGKLFSSTNLTSWTTVNTGMTANIKVVKYGGRSSVPAGVGWITQTGVSSLTNISYGNNLWVAVGYGGEIKTSTDRISWTTRTSNITRTIKTISYGNNGWLGLFDDSSTFKASYVFSTDAITWVTRILPFNFGQWANSSFNNGSIWAVGANNGGLATSTDAITWTTQTSNFGFYQVRSVAYGNSLWIAGGYSGQIRTSTDGVTWATQTSNFGSTTIRSIAYGNSLWIAGGFTGQIRTSTDGVTWTTQNSNFGTSNVLSIAYGNSLWIAGGYSGQIRTSTDGVTWATQNSNFGANGILSIAYGNSLWIAGGGSNLRTSQNINTNFISYFIGGD